MRKDKHLEQNLNKEVEIKLFKPIDKKKTLIGVLKRYDADKIYITDTEEKAIERKQIAQIKVRYNW